MNLVIARPLGRSGIRCPVLGLGTGRLASVAGGLSRQEAIRLIEAASECGVTLLDTADSYGQGDAEAVIGRAIRGRRENYILSTKAGYSFGRPPWWLRGAKPIIRPLARRLRSIRKAVGAIRQAAPVGGLLRQNFSSVNISQRLDDSLRRLGTDYVDLFFLHDATPAALADESLFITLRSLREAGKTREVGVSSNVPEVLMAALRIEGVTVLQTAVNPRQAGALRSVLAAAEEKGVRVVANQCFLSGRLNEERFAALHAAISRVAAKYGSSVDSVLLAFALAQPAVACALTGTRQVARLRENVVCVGALPHLELADIEVLMGAA